MLVQPQSLPARKRYVGSAGRGQCAMGIMQSLYLRAKSRTYDMVLHSLCSCAVMSPWRYLVPTGTSDRDGQELLSWSSWCVGHRGLLASCGRERAEDRPLESWGKLVCERGAWAGTSYV